MFIEKRNVFLFTIVVAGLLDKDVLERQLDQHIASFWQLKRMEQSSPIADQTLSCCWLLNKDGASLSFHGADEDDPQGQGAPLDYEGVLIHPDYTVVMEKISIFIESSTNIEKLTEDLSLLGFSPFPDPYGPWASQIVEIISEHIG